MSALAAQALVLGAASSLHCLAMCGPFAVRAASDGSARGFALYGAGKTLTYAFLGALAGTFAHAVPERGLRPVQAWAAIAAAVLLVLLAAHRVRPVTLLPRLAAMLAPVFRSVSRAARTLPPWWRPFGLGAVTGFLPCSVVAVALVTAVGSGSAGAGAACLALLSLSTLPALAIAGFSSRLARERLGARSVAAATILLLLLAAGMSLWRGIGILAADPAGPGASCCH